VLKRPHMKSNIWIIIPIRHGYGLLPL